MKIKYFLGSTVIFLALLGHGQVSVPGSFFQSIEIFNDSSTLAFHSSVHFIRVDDNSFNFLDPQIRISGNTNYPRGLNDGTVWKGKGITSELHLGVSGKLGSLSYTFYPVIYHSQNLRYDLSTQLNSSINSFGYQYTNGLGGGVDWVQRYGSSAFFNFHPGQSEVRLQFGKFFSAISTQNYSAGPSVFNPIILSRQGGGFPHLRIGSDPFNVKIKGINLGKLEANFLMGYLKESDYFDKNNDNDNSYFNGLFLAYTPPFMPNLTLGFNKVLYKQTQRFSPQDLYSVIVIKDTIGPNDQFDQLASATMEWKFLEVGFRAYAEFAYNDFGGNYKWIEPEHSRAYTIGFEKHTDFENKDVLIIIYEHTNLSRNHTYMWRAEPTFYIHSVNIQGYTNRGQILGAGIGPGANSDMVSIKYNHQNQTFGLGAQRIEKNKDYFVVNIQDRRMHDIEYSFGTFYQMNFDKLLLSFELIYSKNLNRYYVLDNNQANLYTSLQLNYKMKNRH